MKPECPAWAPPLLALQFLTRVPVPGVGCLSEEGVRVGLGRAMAWFPLVGAGVGSIAAGTMLLAEQVWPRFVAVVVALIVEALLTGAFHEDAVADFCDGVGGGRDPEHVRKIMKDSRIGSYGALGLTLAVSLRALLMFSLAASLTVPAIIAAATLGRLTAAVVMTTTPPAQASTAGLASFITRAVRFRDVALACAMALPGLLPLASAAPLRLFSAVLAATAFLVWLRPFLMRRVGGATGDCLGFAVYAVQLLVLLAATAS